MLEFKINLNLVMRYGWKSESEKRIAHGQCLLTSKVPSFNFQPLFH